MTQEPAAAPSTTSGSLDERARAAALSAGAPKVPRRAIAIGVAAAAVLALGGTALEHAVSAAGLNPIARTTPGTTPHVVTSIPATTGANELLGVERTVPVAAPRLVLTDQHHRTVSLAALRGKVVVLSFFDATCTDTCRIVAAELRRADAALGAERSRVVFVTVNTDPRALRLDPAPAAVAASGLGTTPSWHFVSGPLRAIDLVWRAFGVTIDLYPSTGLIVHNDPVIVVDQRGNEVRRDTPLVVEHETGAYSLSPALVARAGTGLAAQLRAVLGAPR